MLLPASQLMGIPVSGRSLIKPSGARDPAVVPASVRLTGRTDLVLPCPFLTFFPIGIRRLRPSVSICGPPPRECRCHNPSNLITRGRPDRWYLIAASGSQGLGSRAAEPRPETICGSQRTRVDSGGFVSTGVSTKLRNFEKPQWKRIGASGKNRTSDQGLMSPLLYR